MECYETGDIVSLDGYPSMMGIGNVVPVENGGEWTDLVTRDLNIDEGDRITTKRNEFMAVGLNVLHGASMRGRSKGTLWHSKCAFQRPQQGIEEIKVSRLDTDYETLLCTPCAFFLFCLYDWGNGWNNFEKYREPGSSTYSLPNMEHLKQKIKKTSMLWSSWLMPKGLVVCLINSRLNALYRDSSFFFNPLIVTLLSPCLDIKSYVWIINVTKLSVKESKKKITASCYGPQDAAIIQVLVRTLSGRWIAIDIKDAETVKDLKNKVQQIERTPLQVQRMMFKDKMLRNDQLLVECGVKHGSAITILLELKGGFDEEDQRKLLKDGIGQKKRQKSRLTQLHNKVRNSLGDNDVGGLRLEYDERYEETTELITKWLELAERLNDKEKVNILEKDLEAIERNYENMIGMIDMAVKLKQQEGMASHEKDRKEVSFPTSESRSSKGSNQKSLRSRKKIEIAVFNGNAKEYEDWKASFMACIDEAEEAKSEKLLHLRQYLQGEPERMVRNLGYSDEAYDMALARLENRYGGEERSYNNLLKEIESFRPVREDEVRDLEAFAELMDTIILRFTKMGKIGELENGFLYQKLSQKLTRRMLTKWIEVVAKKEKENNVKDLQTWVEGEAKIARRVIELSLNQKGGAKGEAENPWPNRKRVQKNTCSLFANEHQANEQRSTPQGTIVNRIEERRCVCCNGRHFTGDCWTLKKMLPAQRWDKVKEWKLCFCCLKAEHMISACKEQKKCGVDGCEKIHHPTLHTNEKKATETVAAGKGPEKKFPWKRNQNKYQRNNKEDRQDNKPENTHITVDGGQNETEREYVSLRTIPVILEKHGRRIKVNALLDDASTISYVSEKVYKELGLEGKSQEVQIGVVEGRTQKIESRRVTMVIESLDAKERKEFSALALKEVTGNMKIVDWAKKSQSWTHLKGIRFPSLNERPTVDVLIGADYLSLQRAIEERKGKEGEPIARLTPLGWTCVGGNLVGREFVHQTNFVRTFLSQYEDTLDTQVRRFWELDNIEESPTMTTKDREVFDSSIIDLHKVGERYEVGLPWKEKEKPLPYNREMAERRLTSLGRRFQRDGPLAEEYRRMIEDYLRKGYIRRITNEEEADNKWLLPHFPVVKMDRQTTKIRIVFDAAAKTAGECLNDRIECGPKLQNDLVNVLLRFRRHKIAIVCDISEMYLQISIVEQDRRFLRFLWEEDGEIHVYEFQRLVFGLNTSPFLAQLVSQENARRFINDSPRASETVIKSTYMDDSLDSVSSVEEALRMRTDLEKLWQKAGMLTRKWMSNSKDVLDTIPLEQQAKTIDIESDEALTMKTLGLRWRSEEDMFGFSVKMFSEEKLTKRNLLSWIARIFDPLGMLAAYVIRGKILIQTIWMMGLDWDDRIPEEIERKARKWLEEASDLDDIKIPRCLQSEKSSKWELHVFSDASELAFGAVIYLKEENEIFKKITFIAAKSKVAPIKTVSIPRLELLGACIGLKLAKKVALVLECDLHSVTFWSDSVDVLCWIRERSRKFKPFVANRIGTIQSETKPNQWRFVPTKENPADLLTRGMSAKECCEEGIWWCGPKFLTNEREDWPVTNLNKKQERQIQTDIERKVTFLNIMDETIVPGVSCFNPETYSSWKRLRKIYAWVLRFVRNCRVKENDRNKKLNLGPEELEEADIRIIRSDQKKHFRTEINNLINGTRMNPKSKILSMNPRLDEEGILRSDSRVVNAEFMSPEARYPIILSYESWVAHLIIGEYHLQTSHYAGVSHLLSDLRRKYWVLKARKKIKSYEQGCLECKRRRAKGWTQKMAPLPSFRFKEPFRAFLRTAVDFAGPFETIQGRGRVRTKRYLCLFTCLQTRAVHLELAYGLETDAFVRALIRFMERRGKPEMILSDNGTNFVGASREIREMVPDSYGMGKILNKQEIRWVFNPPAAPHFGGVYESLVKSAKKAMEAVLGIADVTDEELVTVLTRVEAMLNSRPLIVQIEDVKGLEALTPDHFLKVKWCGEDRDASISANERVSMLRRWRRVLQLSEQVWQRWMKELVPTWSSREKWKEDKQEIKDGEVVWILDRKTATGRWPLGRVVKSFKGSDGRVRVVQLIQDGKDVIRPITKLFPLEI